MKLVRTGEDYKNSDGEYASFHMSKTDKEVCYVTRAGVLWQAMRQRVRPDSDAQKLRARYIGCISTFNDFNQFATWCNSQVGYMNKDKNGRFWELDKDIIKPFNTVYSEQTCAFIPNSLNCLFTYSNKARGIHPLGVNYRARFNKFVAQISINAKKVHLGHYGTAMEAHKAWQEAKIRSFECAIKEYTGIVEEKVIRGIELHIDLIRGDIVANKETVR